MDSERSAEAKQSRRKKLVAEEEEGGKEENWSMIGRRKPFPSRAYLAVKWRRRSRLHLRRIVGGRKD